jgi:short-subunit dehydrogenase
MDMKTVLITGCSTGIGLEAAKTLSKKGYQVIATCRTDQDEGALKALGITVVQMDLNNTQSIEHAFQQVLEKTHGRLDVLINNAGFGQAGALEDLSRETIRNQFETNVFGLMDLTRLAIPIMRQQGHGRIINLSSLLGFVCLPFRGAYNASKYAVEGLSDTLRLELKDSNIKVITIEPGPIKSQFRDTSVKKALSAIDAENSHFKSQYAHLTKDFTSQKEESTFTLGPEAVVKQFIHAIEAKHPKAKYRVTFPTHLFAALKRLLPTKLLDKLLYKVSKKELKG